MITIKMSDGRISQIDSKHSGDFNGNNNDNNDGYREVEGNENETELVMMTVICAMW